jgi:F-type H+-transporting ATPase subunit delta
VADARVTQTYAQAFFEQTMAGLLTPLKTIAASIESAGLTEQLDNASLEFRKKQVLLRPLFPANTAIEVQNLVTLLASKNHIHLLPEVIREFDRYSHLGPVGVLAKVTSAVPLTSTEKSALESKIKAQFGNELTFEYVIDQQILGGVIVRVGDKEIDGSVAGKFAELKEKLK